LKRHLEGLLGRALDSLQAEGYLPEGIDRAVLVERTRERSHGDFASNLALRLAKAARRPPRELAERLRAALPASELVSGVELAGPGFLNFSLAPAAFHAVLREVIEQGEAFGCSTLGANRPVQVEFVSANPTGPLHVGHGRGAAYGATVANLLTAVGFAVCREYYVNDAGRQMDILAASVWLRYLEHCGERFDFPSNGYRGEYVREIASILYDEHGKGYAVSAAAMFEGIAPDVSKGGDKEAHIDGLVRRAKELLGDNRYRYVFELGLNSILDDIRSDLAEFGVEYDQWYSERSLGERGLINHAVEKLRQCGKVYVRDGALWFRSSDYGDEKDRVVQRENGQTTYFASDIAYHLDKFERGFERVVDIWGADHHGYVPRVKAALSAMGLNADALDVLLVQFAILYRGGERVQMSTRSGSFVTLRELRNEVGRDAARFFYVMRRSEQHLDFDLDLATSQSNDNPVYYVQYAHARVCSVMRQLVERGLRHDPAAGVQALGRLTEPHEQTLLSELSRYPETVETAALIAEPHILASYLREVATAFHTYYNAHAFLTEESELRDARLCLILATRRVIANGLGLLGVSAPESM
jgi:arginyl-tRNA synthetase